MNYLTESRGKRIAIRAKKYRERQAAELQANADKNLDSYSTIGIARSEVRGILRNTSHEYKFVSGDWPKEDDNSEATGSEVFQDGGIFAVIEYTRLPNGRWRYKFL